MQGKRILLGVTGGIAAYKSADLVRRLIEQGAQVQVVMTAAAREFVTSTTFQALSGRAVRTDLWDAQAEAAMGHIELARWAELVLVAPASADFLARLAHGLADDLLSTLCLATEAPIAVAPAMNQLMWRNLATRANVDLLTTRGVQIIGPGVGDQACGEYGPCPVVAVVHEDNHVQRRCCRTRYRLAERSNRSHSLGYARRSGQQCRLAMKVRVAASAQSGNTRTYL